MIVLGVDPGNRKSAWVVYASRQKMVLCSALEENRQAAANIEGFARNSEGPERIAIELIRSSYGNPAGPELFDTVLWSGRFLGHWLSHRPIETALLIPRLDIRIHLTGAAKAGDAGVRAALIERLGPKATKGITTHRWAALAAAVTAADRIACGIPGKEKELCI